MAPILKFIYILITLPATEAIFWSNDHKKISVELIGKLQIKFSIVVTENLETSLEKLKIAKDFSERRVPNMFMSEHQFFKYILEIPQPDRKTGVFYTVSEYKTLRNFLSALNEDKKSYYVTPLTIIIFENKEKPLSTNYMRFWVPYDAQLIVVQNDFSHPNQYKLSETYALKDKIIVKDLGFWNNKFGLKSESLSMYFNRFDMNQTSFLAVAKTLGFKNCSKPGYRRVQLCHFIALLRMITERRNFRYVEKLTRTLTLPEVAEIDAYYVTIVLIKDRKYSTVLHYYPKARMEWFIRRPKLEYSNNYLTQPFTNELWLVILLVMLAGITFQFFIKYFKTFLAKNITGFFAWDALFFPMDLFCNQDGSDSSDGSGGLPFSVVTIVFRWMALFLLPSYTGDLTSLLTIQTINLPFGTLEGFVKHGEYYMLTMNGSYTHGYFKNNKNTMIRRIPAEFMTFYASLKEAAISICSNRNLVYPGFTVQPFLESANCTLEKIPIPIAQISQAMPLGSPKVPSPFKRILNHDILSLAEAGVTSKIARLNSDPEFPSSVEEGFYPVELEQVSQILLLFIYGVLVSVIVHLNEVLIKYIIKKKIYKSKKLRESI